MLSKRATGVPPCCTFINVRPAVCSLPRAEGSATVHSLGEQRGFLNTRKDNPTRLAAGVDAAGRKAGASIAAALAGGGPGGNLFPWDDKEVERSVCTDTCARARDGTCDDGRSGVGQVISELGTSHFFPSAVQWHQVLLAASCPRGTIWSRAQTAP